MIQKQSHSFLKQGSIDLEELDLRDDRALKWAKIGLAIYEQIEMEPVQSPGSLLRNLVGNVHLAVRKEAFWGFGLCMATKLKKNGKKRFQDWFAKESR